MRTTKILYREIDQIIIVHWFRKDAFFKHIVSIIKSHFLLCGFEYGKINMMLRLDEYL